MQRRLRTVQQVAFTMLVTIILSYLAFVSTYGATTTTKCELAHSFGRHRFPDNFTFGVSTAAYQIEGGWNEDGKGPSIWDTYTHQHPEMIADHSTGDIGPDSYHRFEQDLQALKEMKVNFYRFSIAWSRILPNADVTMKNQPGIDYYNMVIDKLLENNIQPMVTMFHYDLPETLNGLGGFTNDLFIDYFRSYAKLLFELFGDRVKLWITFNEPFDYCVPGYGAGEYPPMVHMPGVADYQCMENTLKAHAVAYRLYREKFFASQQGKVGITISSRFYFSKTNNTQLVQKAMQYSLGWLGHPLFTAAGNYPEVMLQDVVANSVKEGRDWSRLRALDDHWLPLVRGAADFLGLNYYTSRYVEEASPPRGENPSWEHDSAMKYTLDPSWRRAKSSWLYCVPEGLEGLLKWIRDNYNNIEVFVTENGWSDDGQLDDSERIDYLKAHLQAVLNAVNSGCNVTRYTHWSLIDNFEWRLGYTERFGLYYVNMTSDTKERVPKNSSRFFRNVIVNKTIPN